MSEKLVSKIRKRLFDLLSKEIITDAVNSISQFIIIKIKSGEGIKVPNFGALEPVIRAPHNALNVGTGKIYYLEARKFIRFIADTKFKEILRKKKALLKKDLTSSK